MTEPGLAPGTQVLVTGATGFTGSVLVRRLLSRGVRVRAIARPSSDLSSLAGLDIEWLRGEVYDGAIAEPAVRDCRVVFHVAAAYRQAGVPDDTYRRVHVESTQHLADAARRVGGFERFVLVSTIGVHGHIEHPPADERTPFAPGDLYQATKAQAEEWLVAWSRKMRFPYAIVRPCAIYGPGDTRLLKLFRMARRGLYLTLGRPDTLYHLVHVDDLAAILERAAVHPAATGEAFIAGADAPMRLDDIVQTIGAVYGRRVRTVRLPAAPVFALAAACEWLCRPFGLEPPLHRRRVAFFTKSRAFDTRKLREVLAYRHRYTNQEGLAMTARWYVEQGWL